MKLASFAAILATVLLVAPAALAQNLEERTPFTLSILPANPAPFATVTVTPVPGALDLGTAVMTVNVNGTQVYEGNAQPTSVTVGKGGSSTSIRVTMRAGGFNPSQTVVVVPQDVSLVMEPASSAPPLYPGKTSVSDEGTARFVAVASLRTTSSKSVPASSLSYAWTVDGVAVPAGSGIGKSSLIVAAPLQYRSRTVSVAVQTVDGALRGTLSLSFSSAEPSLRIYENDPLLGVRFDRALSGTYETSESESSLYASPFGFSLANGAAAIEWFLNGSSVHTGNLITLRPVENGKGNASISAVASVGDTVRVNTRLSVSFGATTGFNLFGL